MTENTMRASDLARIEALKMRADAIKIPLMAVANIHWDSKIVALKSLDSIADKLDALADKLEAEGR